MVIHWSRFRKKSGLLWKRTAHKEFGTTSRKRCWWNSLRVDVQFSVQRLHCPGVNSEAKNMKNCRFTLQPTRKQLGLFFRIIVSANQLSLYGAVANMCEECESFHDRSGQPDKVMGQSIVLSEIKTEVLLENDASARSLSGVPRTNGTTASRNSEGPTTTAGSWTPHTGHGW